MFSSYYTLMDQLQGHLKVKGQNREKKNQTIFFGKEGCKGYGNALMFPIYMIGSVLLEKSGVLHYGQNKSIRKLRSSSLVMSKDSFSSHSDGQEKRQLTI